jgi:gamma-glutamyltranspeptidase / glutathione hydrolase
VDGRAPDAGEVVRNPNLAAASSSSPGAARCVLPGPIAKAIAADMKARNGLLIEADLAAHRSDWVEPISTTYRGYEVLELGPNTQGIVALQMLNILEGFDLKAMGHNSAEYLHTLVEAKRIAFADRNAWIADADAMPAEALERMLSKEYAAERRKEIDPAKAAESYRPLSIPGRTTPGEPRPEAYGDTIYLTAADREGNVISLIQSIYEYFGAGIVAGDTGIVLHNRGSQFSLDPSHPNALAPGKRPFHTLVPAMVMKDGRPWFSFGVMGGDMQPQGHVQVLVNLIDFGMNVQDAGEAARFRHVGNGLALETNISADGARRARGARASAGRALRRLGRLPGDHHRPGHGVMLAGSDPRKDGLAIGW